MADLARHLCDEGFAAAGLVATTSIFELFLGRSTDILNNPHLCIRPSKEFAVLIYEDGSDPPWTLQVGYDELFDRVKRILVKRARWFRELGRRRFNRLG